jgi:hypothetical protein
MSHPKKSSPQLWCESLYVPASRIIRIVCRDEKGSMTGEKFEPLLFGSFAG